MPNDTLSCTDISIRVDKPTPGGVIVPALEIIQPRLYGVYLAARVKMGGKKLEITRAKEAYFIIPGEGYLSRDLSCEEDSRPFLL